MHSIKEVVKAESTGKYFEILRSFCSVNKTYHFRMSRLASADLGSYARSIQKVVDKFLKTDFTKQEGYGKITL